MNIRQGAHCLLHYPKQQYPTQIQTSLKRKHEGLTSKANKQQIPIEIATF